jgi:hypothetical protein
MLNVGHSLKKHGPVPIWQSFRSNEQTRISSVGAKPVLPDLDAA